MHPKFFVKTDFCQNRLLSKQTFVKTDFCHILPQECSHVIRSV